MSEQKIITILDLKKQELKRLASVPNVLFSKKEKANSTNFINVPIIEEDYNSDDLDDDEWLAKKKEFWEKNKITPIIVKDGAMNPKDLEKLLAKTFDK